MSCLFLINGICISYLSVKNILQYHPFLDCAMLHRMNTDHLSDTRFSDLPIAPEIKQSLDDAGFEFCTPVQAETMEHSLQGKDIAGQAQTGTGKTAAFLIPALQQLLNTKDKVPDKRGNVKCLIVAPTRELAIQIASDADTLGKHTGLKTALVYGGAAYEQQRRQFDNQVDILVGTPGRLIDYLKQNLYTLKHIQVLILDEADRMFDLGFINDIRFMMQRMPSPDKRLNLVFSATLSQRVLELAYEHMDSPVKIEIQAETVSAKNIDQRIFYPATDEKIPLLIGLIQKEQPFRTIIFVNTKRNAENIQRYLVANNISAAMISGDVKQNKRQSLLEQFEQGKYSTLIATDVAARGLHISDVSHVINFDLPSISEDYVHRIGRTARAGASGHAISFACEETAFNLPGIESYIGVRLPVESITNELLPEIKKPKYQPRKKPKFSGKGKRGGYQGNKNNQNRNRNSRQGGNNK